MQTRGAPSGFERTTQLQEREPAFSVRRGEGIMLRQHKASGSGTGGPALSWRQWRLAAGRTLRRRRVGAVLALVAATLTLSAGIVYMRLSSAGDPVVVAVGDIACDPDPTDTGA